LSDQHKQKRQIVYIDTNVFSYLLLPHKQSLDPLVKQANRFADEIANGSRFIGVTSTFTQTEYRAVSKRRISEHKGSQITTQEEAYAMNDFGRTIDALGIAIVDADQVAPDISGVLSLFGACDVTIRRCNPVPRNGGKWKVISSVDVLMLNLAIRMRADLFATFDDGFRGYNHSDSFIAPFIIPDEYNDL
jgi:predicted nucleic acid-binding protein